MGLDMYLYQKQYVQPKELETLEVPEEGELSTISKEYPATVLHVVGYWRKANHIHRWFVENVQDGVDNCAEYAVTRSQMKLLEQAVQIVISNSEVVEGNVSVGYTLSNGRREDHTEDGLVIKDTTIAKKILPTLNGFFFGKADYDEHYIAALHDTIDIIRTALAAPADVDFSYRAFW